MRGYDHKKIEKKWQKKWEADNIYTTPDTSPKKDNFYLLTEFPYPSGNLHVGHWYAFSVPDILARYLRMRGKNVLYPIGFDAFGLPAENAAIKNKLNPRTWTEENIAYMRKQIRSMGASFDWSREVVTCDPAYYKWTQWLFLQLFKKGLVYQKETAVNWCPNCKTVLANEQVVDGRCERCDTEVVQKQMLQWNIKITDYADRLIDDLEKLDWPREIKESQKNWIGRSEGAEIDFPLAIDDVKRIILLHGKGGSAVGAWKPWLKMKLEAMGYEVQIPALPNTNEPNDEEQADYVQKHCTLDEHTAIVGHSFGGVVALRLLERGVKVRRVALVATPYSGVYLDGKERPSVTAILKKGFDFEKIKKQSDFVLLYDTNDHVVPMSDGEAFAEKLGCYLVRGKGVESHFNGAVEPDVFLAAVPAIRVFTTRPDTLFGATYLVLAPEHPWLTLALQHKTVLKNHGEVQSYVDQSKKKTELQRQTGEKEKTGVRLERVEAVNPATGGKIPMFVADYVLGHYGTGAIMAVPAHDQRDFEFAKKFNLPVQHVLATTIQSTAGADAVHAREPFVEKNAVMCIIKHWAKDEYLCIKWRDYDVRAFVSGGIEKGEDAVAAGIREIREETGYLNPKFIRHVGGPSIVEFYHQRKKENTRTRFEYLYFELEDGKQEEISTAEDAKHEIFWKTFAELSGYLTIKENAKVLGLLATGSEGAYVGEGILMNSDGFDDMSSEEARRAITEKYGRLKTTYKLRDWIVSRQRYWGVPIPIVHCKKCGAVSVSEEDLPVVLPEVDDYLPEGTGKSPLAKKREWVEVKCPSCGGVGERETDTLDTFVDSSWYFLRYADPLNSEEFASKENQKQWMPVDLYSGGAEHTTMHVLYSRFWHKALFDLGLVADSEPYVRRMNRSLILGPDGQKMSKSRGNVVDPDAVVERLGADTVRMYLAFIGPYNEVSSYPWNPDGVVGVRRFLERVFRAEALVVEADTDELSESLHETLKKVGEDIEQMKFNTAVSALMILLNAIEKAKTVSTSQWDVFLRMLAPFAPHVAEELWSVRHQGTIHDEEWPEYDASLIARAMRTIVIQVNGKKRGELRVASDAANDAVESDARQQIAPHLEGKRVLKTIFVPGRLVNFVVV
ncbi:MAG: Leucyl-tRNA synthetase [Parcubacteria group bacterium GW2011_GWA2_51_10]|nr:MAG: Leucyl-tRNA synthetase [Parcubacteria group bacterium GW2011_GWA2_51_10]